MFSNYFHLSLLWIKQTALTALRFNFWNFKWNSKWVCSLLIWEFLIEIVIAIDSLFTDFENWGLHIGKSFYTFVYGINNVYLLYNDCVFFQLSLDIIL